MGAEGVAAVVGHVEPLVAVGRPRVGHLDAVGEVAGRRARRRPQPERAVDVHPGAVVVGPGPATAMPARGRRRRRCSRCRPAGTTMVGPAGPAARTPARSSTSIAPSPSTATASRLAAPKPSRRRDRSIVACRSAVATTRTGARRPAVLLDVPARPRQHVVPGGGEPDGVRPLPARHEAERGRAPGSPSSSFSQRPATSSTTAAAGEVTALKASWSHPAASTSAAVAASRAPPTTKPK